MTVTIHLAPGTTKTVLRRLITLAGGDRTQVRSGNTGLVVSDELALAYLSDQQPAAPCCATSSHPVPPNLARAVRQAENTAGLLQAPDTATAEDKAPTTTRTSARRPRRTQQGAAV